MSVCAVSMPTIQIWNRVFFPSPNWIVIKDRCPGAILFWSQPAWQPAPSETPSPLPGLFAWQAGEAARFTAGEFQEVSREELECRTELWDFTYFGLDSYSRYIYKDIQIKLACMHAKSLQLCPTLCDPIEGSPPGSAVPGILQARTLEWVAISLSNAWK